MEFDLKKAIRECAKNKWNKMHTKSNEKIASKWNNSISAWINKKIDLCLSHRWGFSEFIKVKISKWFFCIMEVINFLEGMVKSNA